MKRLLQHLYLLALLTCGQATTWAKDVILFIQPLENAEVIGRAQSNDPAITDANEVLDISAAAKGWKWTEINLTTEGYVPTKSVTKNFEITPGTLIRNRANSGAIILTKAEATDRFEVLDAGTAWTQVRFNKPIPVYFNLSKVSPDTFVSTTVGPAQPKPRSAPVAASAATSSPDISNFNPNETVGTTSPTSLQPENVQWRSVESSPAQTVPAPVETYIPEPATPAPTEVIVSTEYAVQAETPRAPQIAVGSPTRTLSGKLVREIRSYGPRYPLRLKSGNGKRVAYVDISGVFVSDLRPYLGQRVFISGEVRPVVPGSKELIIHARILRLAD
ncbi:MAG: hypothetical protein AAGC73_09940 [Verrucomicrobiota bacterium]